MREDDVPRTLAARDLEAALRGGAVLAAGGGGWREHGRQLGEAALARGTPRLVHPDELPDDAVIATVAAIGAPGDQTAWEMRPDDYVRALLLLEEALGRPVDGLMIGQNGMSSTINGWYPGVLLGRAVVDAAGDIRAHPTGDMGSLGLHADPAPTVQTAVGGNRAEGRYMEVVLRGATARISPVLRAAAHHSGGFIASCRNPVEVNRVRSHGAAGAISVALAIGDAILGAEPRGAEAVIAAICDVTGGRILARGPARAALRYTTEAYDIGTVTVGAGDAAVTVHLMNEYLAVTDASGARLATFPDLLTTLSLGTGAPVSAGRVKDGEELAVLHAPVGAASGGRLPLASALCDPTLYPAAEAAIGLPIVPFLPAA